MNGNTGALRFSSMAVALLIGVSLGEVLGGLLLALAALMFVKAGTAPLAAAPTAAALISGASSFAAGWFTVKLCKNRGLVMGALSGALLFLSLFAAALITGGTAPDSPLILRFIVCTACGAIGGVARVNKRSKIKTR